MKLDLNQLVLRNGHIAIESVPIPIANAGEVIVKNYYSAISIGTERAIISESRKGILQKAMDNPELIKQAFSVLISSGMRSTLEIYESVVHCDSAIGYSSCGEVIAIGDNVTDIQIGDIVACGGAGKALHSEIVAVPRNLVFKVQPNVHPRDASFTTIASIAIHGLRRTGTEFGETIAIIGLGLLGLLAAKIAVACGLNVLAYDPNHRKSELANGWNSVIATSDLDKFYKIIMKETNSKGTDAALICASADDSKPIDLASRIIRNEGKIVLVGTSKILLSRDRMFESEAEFLVSRSYGPGRYDPLYEERGLDYPFEYVRWTENRNMGFFLDLLSSNRLTLDDLGIELIPFDEAPRFYDSLIEGKISPTAAVICYDLEKTEYESIVWKRPMPRLQPTGRIALGIIGAGTFAQTVLLPKIISNEMAEILGVCNKTPLSSLKAANKWNAAFATSNPMDIINSKEISHVIISTPHDSHAELVIQCLKHGKHTFVEKPLCLTRDELESIIEVYKEFPAFLMVGFNRRYSPWVVRIKEILDEQMGPLTIDYDVKVSRLPPNHWINNPELGGGRLVGEACHFFDLFRYLIDVEWKRSVGSYIDIRREGNSVSEDFIVSTQWADGSISTLKYTTLGSPKLPKETIRININSLTIILRDFRELEIITETKRKTLRSKQSEKGHKEEIDIFLNGFMNDDAIYSIFHEAIKSMELTFDAYDSVRKGYYLKE